MKSLPADNIHQRLCDLRNGTGKSQKEVADELNIQASVLSRIERGETKSVSHDLIIKFAEYYNVSTDYLLCISDIRIRRNVELEELGLTNKALLQLLQGNVNGDILSRLLEHRYFPQLLDTVNSYFTEEHNAGFASRNAVIDIGTASLKELIKENPDCRTETQHGIREINAQKITGTEADIEKIRSIFLVILKDIKKEYDIPLPDISMEELQKQLTNMRKQALFQKKKNPKFIIDYFNFNLSSLDSFAHLTHLAPIYQIAISYILSHSLHYHNCKFAISHPSGIVKLQSP